MTALTLTAKGQLPFNRQLLDHLGAEAGDRLVVKKLPDGALKIEAEKNRIDILSLSGSMKSAVRLSDGQLQQAITQCHVGRGIR